MNAVGGIIPEYNFLNNMVILFINDRYTFYLRYTVNKESPIYQNIQTCPSLAEIWMIIHYYYIEIRYSWLIKFCLSVIISIHQYCLISSGGLVINHTLYKEQTVILNYKINAYCRNFEKMKMSDRRPFLPAKYRFGTNTCKSIFIGHNKRKYSL